MQLKQRRKKKMRALLLSLTLLLTACGGGGSSTQSEPEPDPDPVFNIPLSFTYEIQQVGEVQKYNGRVQRIDGLMVTYPTSVGNSGFSVTGRFEYTLNQEDQSITLDLSLYEFTAWGRIRHAQNVTLYNQGGSFATTFDMNGAEFDFVLTPEYRNYSRNLSLTEGEWQFNGSSFDEDKFMLNYDGESVSGYTTKSGCNVNGEINDHGTFYFELQLELSGCAKEGSYNGVIAIEASQSNDIKAFIIGAVSSENHGARILHNVKR